MFTIRPCILLYRQLIIMEDDSLMQCYSLLFSEQSHLIYYASYHYEIFHIYFQRSYREKGARYLLSL